MLGPTQAPVVLEGVAAALWFLRFARDPIQAMAHSYKTHGPFLKLPYPSVREKGTRALVIAIGAKFNREVLGNPTAWRPVNIGPPGPRDSSVRRLNRGILGMTGAQHKHYRRLIVPPLQRIDDKGAQMIRLAEEQVDSWPMDKPIDLDAHTKKLVRTFAIGLLFGDDRPHGYPVADRINQLTKCNFSWRIFACPLNIPGTPYHQMVRNAEDLERRLIKWGKSKRGPIDNRDLLSIVVNNPDETGCPVSAEIAVNHTPTLFGASFDTCQNGLLWALVLLDQHPQIARDLYDELQGSGGGPSSYQQLVELPLLDAIVRESLRILPPVPQQIRYAQVDTSLNGYPLPRRTKVVLSPFMTNRDPDLYPHADRFQPDRWAAVAPSAYQYSVFSGGPRGCPGYGFAIALMKVGIATIMTRYRIAVQPGARIDYKVNVTLTPRRAIPAVFHRQDGAFAASPIRGKIRDLVQFPNGNGQ